MHFTQNQGALNRDGNGTGLGLATLTPFPFQLYNFFPILVPNVFLG